MSRSLPFDPALDQRMSRDIARQANPIEYYPGCKRWNELELATAIATVVAVVALRLWA